MALGIRPEVVFVMWFVLLFKVRMCEFSDPVLSLFRRFVKDTTASNCYRVDVVIRKHRFK